MDKAMVRQRFSRALLMVIACLGAGLANALQPSAAALESQAQAEFAMAGTAVRERLEREAAGDFVGARIAAQDADAHRYRFLDIQRELSRRHPPSVASLSVEAPRNPFLPDASFWTLSAPSPIRVAPAMAGWPDAGNRVEYPAWAMYRPHEPGDPTGTDGAEQQQEFAKSAAGPAGRAGDLYSKAISKPTSGEPRAVATDTSASASLGEAPREPYLVYRERLAGGDTRE